MRRGRFGIGEIENLAKNIVILLEIGVRAVYNDLKEGISAFDRLPAPPFLGFLPDPQLLELFNFIPDFKKNLTIFSKNDLLQKTEEVFLKRLPRFN